MNARLVHAAFRVDSRSLDALQASPFATPAIEALRF
jgi:hypothetical protein